MASGSRLTGEQVAYRTLGSAVLFALAAASYSDGKWVWKPGWVPLALAGAPWIRWLLAFIFENFQTIKVAGIELAVRLTVKHLPELSWRGPVDTQKMVLLLPKAREAETYLYHFITQTSDSDDYARRQICKIARKLGAFYLIRCQAGRNGKEVPAFEGEMVEIARARYLLQIALRHNPRSALSHNSLGGVEFFSGSWREARRRYEEAIRLSPRGKKTAVFWSNLGLSYSSERAEFEGKLPGARIKELQRLELSCHEKALSLRYDHWPAHYCAAYTSAELYLPETARHLLNARSISEEQTKVELAKPDDRRVFSAALAHMSRDPELQEAKEELRVLLDSLDSPA